MDDGTSNREPAPRSARWDRPGGRSLLVFAGLVALTLVYTYPLVRNPARAHRLDSPDAMLNAWILSWDLHQLGRDPLHLFDANIFYPEKEALAYSENLLAAALMVAPARIFTASPILLSNLALILALVTSGFAAFVLSRTWTGATDAAWVAAIAFAFAPYHWAHVPHLQLQLGFGIPASFYFLERWVRGGRWTSCVALGVAVAATFASSGYYGVFLVTALPLVGFAELGRAPARERTLVGGRLVAGALSAAFLTLPLLLPYARKLKEGNLRTVEAAAQFSAGWAEYSSSFSRLHGFLPEHPEPLFPGFAVLGLSLWALVRWKPRTFLPEGLLLALALLGLALSAGPKLGLFSLFVHVVPAYQGLRVPSRAGILFLLALALLASRGLTHVRRRSVRVALVGVVAAECYAGPLPWSFDPPELPPIYEHVASLDEPGALLELPLPHPDRFQDNARYVYRSIFHWRPLVNGYSGFVAPSYRRAYRSLTSEPLDATLRQMASDGVRFVLAHGARLGPRLERQLAEGERAGWLELVVQEGADRLYRIGH